MSREKPIYGFGCPLPFPAYFDFFSDRPASLALLSLALFAVAWLFRRSRKPWLSHIQRKPVLTNNEKEFFYRLKRALPQMHVFPQVAFAAFLTDDGRLSTNARWSVRAKFDRKIADFIICDLDFRVLALVELDDRTHVARADRQRDAITKAAGYQTIRYQSKSKPTESEIAALFQHARAWVG